MPRSTRCARGAADGAARSIASSAVGVVAALALALSLAVLPACDRNMEPYDPNEKVVKPDLSKIFPPGAERAARLDSEEPPGPAPAMPGGPPAMAGGGAPAAGAPGAPMHGTVSVAPDLAGRLPPGAVLYIIARTGAAGPPTAVKRIASPHFPVSFELGPDDRMIQAMPFQGPFQVSAHLDADGDARTHNPGDLEGQAKGPVAPGTDDVKIVLDHVL